MKRSHLLLRLCWGVLALLLPVSVAGAQPALEAPPVPPETESALRGRNAAAAVGGKAAVPAASAPAAASGKTGNVPASSGPESGAAVSGKAGSAATAAPKAAAGRTAPSPSGASGRFVAP